MEYELYHHGILGMKWGIRRYQNKDGSLTSAGKKRYLSTSLSSAIARRENKKTDESFKRWKEQSAARENAINAGKKYNEAKLSGQVDKKELRSIEKEYKRSLSKVSTYRKGQVRQEVGKDLSRSYLTQANRVYKKLQNDPNNRELANEYQRLMNLHDKERYSARRAAQVGVNRSRKIASLKSGLTKTVKAAATTAAVSAGLYFVNQQLNNKGMGINLNSEEIARNIQKVRSVFKYVY